MIIIITMTLQVIIVDNYHKVASEATGDNYHLNLDGILYLGQHHIIIIIIILIIITRPWPAIGRQGPVGSSFEYSYTRLASRLRRSARSKIMTMYLDYSRGVTDYGK